MKRYLYFFIATALLVLSPMTTRSGSDAPIKPSKSRTDTGPNFVVGEIIVKMKPTKTLSPQVMSALEIEKGAQQPLSGGEILVRINPTTFHSLNASDAAKKTIEALKQLRKDPNVEYAQLNYIVVAQQVNPNDPRYNEQWHYFNKGNKAGDVEGGISLPAIWGITTGRGDIVVAVLDTGILPNHPDIMGETNLGQGFDFITRIFTANDGDGRDNDPTDPGDGEAANDCFLGSPPTNSTWHGTHVAGTVGIGNTDNATGVAGVNWRVTVLPVRVLGRCGGTSADINDAIRWAAGLRVPGVPRNANLARIINASLRADLGAGHSCASDTPATQNAINDAVDAGVTIVAAAGNDALDVATMMPAGCDNVIAVSASNSDGNLVTRYSNFGPKVTIMAPGGDFFRTGQFQAVDGVLSLIDGGYGFMEGTSMAAPHVSGVLALWLSCEPALDRNDLIQRLRQTAVARDANQCPQPCGAGLLSSRLPQYYKGCVHNSLHNMTYNAGGWRTDHHVRTVGDVNADGRADLIGFGDNAVFVALAQADGSDPQRVTFSNPQRVLQSFTYNGGWRTDQHVRTVGDVNNDGMADLIGFGDHYVFVAAGRLE